MSGAAAVGLSSRPELTPLEIAGGMPIGVAEDEPPLPELPAGVTPLAAFEDAVRTALRRPPCVVSFSGGRDSSAILAVACRLARTEGYEPPLAVTVRIAEAPGSVEREWQERVSRHVGLDDWLVLDVGEEIDHVGPIAQRLLLRHGVRHPAGAWLLFALQVEHARGGSFLTGFGGDAIVGGWLRSHYAEVRAGHARLGLEDAAALAFAFAPRVVRREALRRRATLPPWMRPRAAHAFRAARIAEFAARPTRWDAFLRWEPRLRKSVVVKATVAELGDDVDALAVHPLHDPRFIAALARAGGARGLGDRSAVMRAVFGADLPDDVTRRSSKANFALAYMRGPTRAFARRWDGLGVDPELVDAERLRAAWLELVPDQRSALLLQAAWLDSVRRGVEQPFADVVQ